MFYETIFDANFEAIVDYIYINDFQAIVFPIPVDVMKKSYCMRTQFYSVVEKRSFF